MRRTREPCAVVAEVAWVNGLAAVRSLGRAGARVPALDHRPGALGFRSRYAEPHVVPDPAADEPAFVAAVARLADGLAGPVPVLATHDGYLEALARNAAALPTALAVVGPPWSALEPLQQKRVQLERAAAAGVAIPRTVHPASPAEARAAAAAVGLPALVKPSQPLGFRRRFGRQAFLCRTADEVAARVEEAAAHAPMVQEFVPGGDDELYTLGSYLDREGTALGLFCGRKLRQTAPRIGTARVAEAVWVDAVVEAGLALLRALLFHGISQVEFKRDPRTGEFKLMEVNPRLWQWHGLAAACGVDLPRIALADALGQRPRPVSMRREERRRWAITALAGAPPAFVRPPYVDAVAARDDPRPALVQGARVARHAAASARRRVLGISTQRVERTGTEAM